MKISVMFFIFVINIFARFVSRIVKVSLIENNCVNINNSMFFMRVDIYKMILNLLAC